MKKKAGKMLAGNEKGCTFAPATAKKSSLSCWSGSSAWLECLPVTQEVAGSSPVQTAKGASGSSLAPFCFCPKSLRPSSLALFDDSQIHRTFFVTNDTQRIKGKSYLCGLI